MSKKNTVVKGFLILTIAGLIVRIIGFAYRLPLTFLIGDDGNGIYGAGFQVYNFFFTISTVGVPVAISKMVSERIALNKKFEAYRVFQISQYLMFVVGIFMSLVLGFGGKIFSHFLNYDRAYYTMVALSPTLLFTSLMCSYRGYFQGLNNMVPTAVSQIVEQIAKAFFAVFLAYALINQKKAIEISAAGATFGTTIGAFMSLIVLIMFYKFYRTKRKQPKVSRMGESSINILKTIIRLSIPVTIGASVITAGNLIDLFMIKSRLLEIGFSEVRASELYGILTGKVIAILNLPTVITAAMAATIVPSISAAIARKDYSSIKKKISAVMTSTMLIILPASVGLSALSDPIIKMLFPTHPEGGYILSVGAYYLVFLALSQNLTSILQALGKPEIPAINLCIGVLIKIILNYYLIGISSINILGTQISSIACYMITFMLNYVAVKKRLNIRFPIVDALITPIIASLSMLIAVLASFNGFKLIFFPKNLFMCLTFSTLSAIILGVSVYFIVLLLLVCIGGNKQSLFNMLNIKLKI